MSYAAIEQVRAHLVDNRPMSDVVYNQTIIFADNKWVRFFAGAVDADSIVIKGRRARTPVRTSVTLAAAPVSIGATHLESGTVVVASDSSLGTVFTENVDFTVDYTKGEIAVREGGGLSVGDTITLWYTPFEPFVGGTDFQLDADHGSVRRLVSGRIAPGETALIDYRPVHASFSDAIVETAVSEANAVIERTVDPKREFGADPTLALAATYRALAIICRTAASRALSAPSGSDRIAIAWMKLAEDYSTRSESFLNEFRPAAGGPHEPVHS